MKVDKAWLKLILEVLKLTNTNGVNKAVSLPQM